MKKWRAKAFLVGYLANCASSTVLYSYLFYACMAGRAALIRHVSSNGYRLKKKRKSSTVSLESCHLDLDSGDSQVSFERV
jgi:hypothetical protein